MLFQLNTCCIDSLSTGCIDVHLMLMHMLWPKHLRIMNQQD